MSTPKLDRATRSFLGLSNTWRKGEGGAREIVPLWAVGQVLATLKLEVLAILNGGGGGAKSFPFCTIL